MADNLQLQLPRPLAWSLYFPNDDYDAQNRRAVLIRGLCQFLSSPSGAPFLSGAREIRGRRGLSLQVDFVALRDASGSADLNEALYYAPDDGLACLGAAVCEAMFGRGRRPVAQTAKPRKVLIRLVNRPSGQVRIRDLKSDLIGKLVTVVGTVVRMSQLKPLVTSMDFICRKCRNVTNVDFPDGRYTLPSRCEGEGCRSQTFSPIHSSAISVDWQKIRIQEVRNRDKHDEEGQIPRTVEVELAEDLVDSCIAGDIVTVVGKVKVINTEPHTAGAKAKGGQRAHCLFLLYIEAVSITNARGQGARQLPDVAAPFRACTQDERPRLQAPLATIPPPCGINFTHRDLEFIVKFSQVYCGRQLQMLVRSLCPSIYGHEVVKAGVLLALVGGVRKHADDVERVPVRGDLHLLLVGDPGLGKSQILQAAATAAPRGLYVCGNTSTSTGLTVSVVKDALTGDYTFEAGAMVLADCGVCCIDEFDKMHQEHQSLLEAMEQQEVSVAKGGLVANLPARTSVIAAANPVGGQYNNGKTVQENLKMSGPMLSRFDLIFLLMDKPDPEMDKKLSEHVMSIHSGAPDRARTAKQRLLDCAPARDLLPSGQGGQPPARLPLSERLKAQGGEGESSHMPVQLLRKYIAYARQYVHPHISREAKAVLQAFFLHLRDSCTSSDSVPVTARQLESLVRLTEARARLDLREVATEEDAQDAVEIVKEALCDKFVDESGLGVFKRRKGSGKQVEARRFLGALARHAQNQGGNIVTMSDIYSVANEIELQVQDVREFVDQLNEAGGILFSMLPPLHEVCAKSRIAQIPWVFKTSSIFKERQLVSNNENRALAKRALSMCPQRKRAIGPVL
ncbi:unnamed protein product [Ostreobium quekettii]|uniref:Probable DNA helicase MCM8 n=1 Tax=Ostreobium quekettii TaxID=121088 RepID=A0A8S1J0B9_9CHLO|nr:unnamed protein product [Ostreobium quekettii]|eukprot:evm.model.scf_1160.2 EVM.evm.TU.scf_1160.2   scf_1160:3209-15257(-)